MRSKSSPFEDGLGPASVYFGFRGAAFLAERAPQALARAVTSMGGRIAYAGAKRKRAIVKRNLARVVGEGPHLDEVVSRAFDSYAEYWLEAFRAGKYSPDDLLTMIEGVGVDAIEEAIASGKGMVLATAHIGFYDLGVSWVGANGFPIGTVAEVLKPRALFEWFAEHRGTRGMEVIPARPRDQARARQVELLSQGKGVALLVDRDLGRRGVWVELFGERTTLPAGPAWLLAKTGARLVAGCIFKSGGGFVAKFWKVSYKRTGDEAADIEAIAQVLAGEVERIVRLAPEQWHLFNTNWPSDEAHLPPRGAT